MSKPPNRYRPSDPRASAEAAFKKATTKPAEAAPAPRKASLSTGKKLVSLRIDRDVLEHFQDRGPGWQERINEVLRNASGVNTNGSENAEQ